MEPTFTVGSRVMLFSGKSEEVMASFPTGSVDAVITDPPYSIGLGGHAWDVHDDFERWSEIWAAQALRVLKPGGHLLSFCATRTYHRMAAGVEDAGFEVRDMLSWMYGSGFPKSTDLGDGWGTALKPAQEPIVLARKPLAERTARENLERHGVGGYNIDDSRIPVPAGELKASSAGRDQLLKASVSSPVEIPDVPGVSGGGFLTLPAVDVIPSDDGRWPTNVIIDEEATAVFDEQFRGSWRFFYCAKPTASERTAGLEGGNPHDTVKPVALMSYLIGLVTPAGGVVLDPFMGSGSTGVAAVLGGFRFLGIDKDPEFVTVSRDRIQHVAGA